MSFPYPLRVALTLATGLAAALLFVALRIPLPWMLGPLIVTAGASMAGAATASWPPWRTAGQWVLGTALGLYFTPPVVVLVASLWCLVVLSIAWTLLLGWLFGIALQRLNERHLPGLDRGTTFFAGAVGGATEMTQLAEREGGRADLVASAHSLRILVVAIVIPLAMQWTGQHGADWNPPGPREVEPLGLGLLLLCSGSGAWLLTRLGRANPWFMGTLLVSMGLTMSGVTLSAVPPWLTNAAQVVIGVSLGVHFRAAFLRMAPRWLGSVALGTLGMIVLSAAFGSSIAWATGLPAATLVLGTAPGGIAEMAITAKVLQLGVALVTTLQVCRVVAVLALVEWLYGRLFSARR